ncbi:MAG: Beta-mannosyltransferase [Chlamydiota bacterium]|jgi:predicted GH43/DUF377 family glycosyl hydrolase
MLEPSRKWLSYLMMWLPALTAPALILYLLHFEKEIRFFKKNALMYQQFVKASFEAPGKSVSSFPMELRNLPLGEKTGIVIGTHSVTIKGVDSPYNASLLKKDKDTYHLFFRYDLVDENEWGGLAAYLGHVNLDRNFYQIGSEFTPLNTESSHAEDPRAFTVGSNILIEYNDLVKEPHFDGRMMHFAEFDPKKTDLKNIRPLDLRLRPIEKNWAPFEYVNEQGISQIYFAYTLSPLKIVKWSDDKKIVSNTDFSSYTRDIDNMLWSKIWGSLRGGTPAQKVGDQYLAFFHSSFTDVNGIIWYCMGAYTFESHPPFRITGISPYPILFEGMYDTPPTNTASPLKRVIFPAGFVVEDRDGKEVIQLSCGENDAGVKIVTLDKDALLQSLMKIKRRKTNI